MLNFTDRSLRQRYVSDWAVEAFGSHNALFVPQRAIRFLEEAIELYQACDGDRAMAHKLLDFIFDRPIGTVSEGLGGVGVTVLGLAQAAGFSADEEEIREVRSLPASAATPATSSR
jgi:hypothetical protein